MQRPLPRESSPRSIEPKSRKDLIARVSEYYRAAHPSHRNYVRIKLRTDPFTRELLDLVESEGPFGRVLDAGCGRGQYALLLAAAEAATEILGFDHDESKVKAALLADRARTGAEESLAFWMGDVTSAALPERDTILLIDVLHYLSAEDQTAVLERAAAALSPGGRLIIRDTNSSRSFGAKLAAGLERIGWKLGINRGREMRFLGPELTTLTLTQLGLRVRRHTPRGLLKNLVLVGEKRS